MTSCRDSSGRVRSDSSTEGDDDGGANDNWGFLDMFGDGPASTDDLFELVRQGSGCRSGPTSLVPSPSSSPPRLEPPSEEEMATWLYPILRVEENQNATDHHRLKDKMPAPAKESSEKLLPSTEGRWCTSRPQPQHPAQETSNKSSERTNTATGARKSHNPETHNLTEKRRRQKINEKLKTLQQLVPGCDKSNYVSTLDQTIQYMKSLQLQIEYMKSASSGAVYHPVVQPPAVAAGLPTTTQLTTAPGMMLARGHVRPGEAVPAMVPVSPVPPFMHHHPAVMMPVVPTMRSYPNVAPQPDARESRRKKQVN